MSTTIILNITILLIVGAVLYFVWRKRGGETSSPSQHKSLLSLYSRDLTLLAKKGELDPVIGRQREIARLIEILSRRTKNNPILVGKSGIGKTAIVEQLAMLIISGDVPDVLKGKHVIQLDLAELVAGTKYRGEFEKRLESIIDEVRASERSIILFIDEVHILAEAGEASGAIGAADMLKPALARGELQTIGATTMVEYQQSIEKDRTLRRRFQPIIVEEATPEETLKILQGVRGRYEDFHHVTITDDALRAAVEKTSAPMPGRHYPDKAIDAVDEAAAKVHLEDVAKKKTGGLPSRVTSDDIAAIIAEWESDRDKYARVATPTAQKLPPSQPPSAL